MTSIHTIRGDMPFRNQVMSIFTWAKTLSTMFASDIHGHHLLEAIISKTVAICPYVERIRPHGVRTLLISAK
jgi:hypothetical protein